MKPFVIALPILFILFIMVSNALSSSNPILIKERIESYHACIRLRAKAPNLNLKCDNILDNIPGSGKNTKKEGINNSGVKILSNEVTITRKVNKSEEIKLRNLIKKLSNENKFRKD